MRKKTLILAACVLSVGVATAGLLFVPGCTKNSSDEKTVDLSGPLPKIAADETTYNFGTMSAGTTKQHAFVIRNDGDAPLHISKLNLSCKCTKGTLKKQVLDPGESTTVDVEWKPERSDPQFQQVLSLETNDPRWADPSLFKLIIQGGVDLVMTADPPSDFKLGAIVEDQPTEMYGTLYSRIVDSFKILGFEIDNKLVTAVATPLDKEELEKVRAKCGYGVKITLAPGIQVGSFKEKVTVKTDINGGTDLPWFVSGERYGPFRIMPLQGASWKSKQMLMDLGQFKAAEGNKGQLRMIVSGLAPDSDLQFTDVHSDVEFVKLQMKPEPTSAARVDKRYILTFEVTPGSPPATFPGPKYVKIHVKTNHPKAEQMEFNVSFVSL